MRIGLAYNEKPDPASAKAHDSTNDAFAEWDDPSTIAAVEQALGLFGSVVRLERLDAPYWRARFVGVKRLLALSIAGG